MKEGYMGEKIMGINMKGDAIIWGAGKIGRGFLAEIFQNANYNITFIEYDKKLVSNLKDAESYTIYKISSVYSKSTVSIDNFDIHATDDIESITNKLLKGDAIAAIAVHQNVLKSIAKAFSHIITEKAKRDPNSKLDIIICVNMHRPSTYFKQLIEEELPYEFHEYLSKNVGLIDSVVMRICPEPTPEILKDDPFAVLTNGYDEMPVDGNAFRGRIPKTHMLKLSEDIAAEETRKIYTLNMSHAILAYVGAYKGYQYAHEAIGDEYIRQIVVGALSEIGEALACEYQFTKEEMQNWNHVIMELLKNPALDDTLVRLGSDTKRKLSAGDRLVGPATLCMKYDIFPENIGIGIAFAFIFGSSSDSGTLEVRRCVEKKGIETAIEKYCEITDKRLLDFIVKLYSDSKIYGI